MHEKILIPKDSYVDIQQDDVDGKTYITVTVEPKRGFEPIDGDFVTIEINGDFPFSDECKTKKLIGILRGKLTRGYFGFGIYAGINLSERLSLNCEFGYNTDNFARTSTEEEKQELLDKLANIGKRWNADKKCVEDIPQRKFKSGDKVRIKEGISSKTHDNVGPSFVEEMDDLLGKTMTVDRYTDEDSYVACEGIYWSFLEDWLEPWSDEPKKDDLCIFWDEDINEPYIQFYEKNGEVKRSGNCDSNGIWWDNAIKWDGTREQFEKVRKGLI